MRKVNCLRQVDVMLVIGVGNFGSRVTNKCIHQLTDKYTSTDDKGTEDGLLIETKVLTLTFGSSLSIEFGSPYILAHIC